MDAVDREPFLQDRLDALVDLVAGALDVELRLGADGEARYRRREVALVRATDKLVLEPQGTDDLGGAGDERDYPRHHLPRIPNSKSQIPKMPVCHPAVQSRALCFFAFSDLGFGIWDFVYTMPQRRRRNHSRASTCTNNRKNATRNGERPFVVRQSGNFEGRGGGFGNGFDGSDSNSRFSSPGRR